MLKDCASLFESYLRTIILVYLESITPPLSSVNRVPRGSNKKPYSKHMTSVCGVQIYPLVNTEPFLLFHMLPKLNRITARFAHNLLSFRLIRSVGPSHHACATPLYDLTSAILCSRRHDHTPIPTTYFVPDDAATVCAPFLLAFSFTASCSLSCALTSKK